MKSPPLSILANDVGGVKTSVKFPQSKYILCLVDDDAKLLRVFQVCWVLIFFCISECPLNQLAIFVIEKLSLLDIFS